MPDGQPSLPGEAQVALRAWYEPRSRAYAWRRGRPSAYRTLVSELMLQQTQAARVEPIFGAFVRRFPTVRALASASRADVLRAWAGLGYNRRAVWLHRAAQVIVERHGGRVPLEPSVLVALPGVGTYTASAVASIAGGSAIPALDVNVRRIVARVGLGREPHEAAARSVDELAAGWIDRADPASWNQSLMDLGRTHCRAVPSCDGCPLRRWCRWQGTGGSAASSAPVRQGRFEGSSRQVRGSIVEVLRNRPSAGPGTLSTATGFPVDRVQAALEGLTRDSVVERRGRSYRLPA